ncbi:hypothetical protein niasHT_036943 [Heterodera trifolii]|uniref:Lon proteolytic domain-containing protein n=1 Tax=Heterodera trifolii TaxID=157864 RepID=A0ABD2ILB9_9BILA
MKHLKAEVWGAFFDQNKINLSIPPPSTKRKEPSASTAATLAFLSLATRKPVQPPGVCVTGKVLKTGRISEIGQLKEKTIAVAEGGMAKIAFPHANLKEFFGIDYPHPKKLHKNKQKF